MTEVSTKPYLIRAIYEWCTDCGYTPYVAVAVDERTQVPREFVKNGEIVLNISATATNRLDLGNEWIDFQARFGGRARDLSIPIENVTAIYARETGHGMAFDVPKALALAPETAADVPADEDTPTQPIEAVKPAKVTKAAKAESTGKKRKDAGLFPADRSVGKDDEPDGGGGALKPDSGSPPKRSKNHLTRVK